MLFHFSVLSNYQFSWKLMVMLAPLGASKSLTHCPLGQPRHPMHACVTEALREAQSQNKDLSRQVQELLAIRHQLEADRDRLAAELSDANDALRDAQSRLEAANAALSQLRIDFEHRLREKDEEIENVRSVLLLP